MTTARQPAHDCDTRFPCNQPAQPVPAGTDTHTHPPSHPEPAASILAGAIAIPDEAVDAYIAAESHVWRIECPKTQGEAVATNRHAIRAGLEAATPHLRDRLGSAATTRTEPDDCPPGIGTVITETTSHCGYTGLKPGTTTCPDPAEVHLFITDQQHPRGVGLAACSQHTRIARATGQLIDEHVFGPGCEAADVVWMWDHCEPAPVARS